MQRQTCLEVDLYVLCLGIEGLIEEPHVAERRSGDLSNSVIACASTAAGGLAAATACHQQAAQKNHGRVTDSQFAVHAFLLRSILLGSTRASPAASTPVKARRLVGPHPMAQGGRHLKGL